MTGQNSTIAAGGPCEDQRVHPTAGTTRSYAAQLTVALATAAVAAGITALIGFDLLAPWTSDAPVTWWMLAIAAIGAELLVFEIEARRESHSFTLSEIPLVLGLFLANPAALLVGRMSGALLFLSVANRREPRKIILNLSSFFAETVVLLGVVQAIGGPGDITQPVAWVGALAAIVAAVATGHAIIFCAMYWHGAQIHISNVLVAAAITIPVNTSFALVIGILLRTHGWATLLLSSVAVFLMLGYRSYTSLRQRFDSLSLLYDFTRLVGGAQRPDEILEGMLTQAKDLLRAERAEIWLNDANRVLALSVSDDGRSERDLGADQFASIAKWFEQCPGTTLLGSGNCTSEHVTAMLGSTDAVIAPVTEAGEVIGLVAVVDRLGEHNEFGDSDRMMFATLANHASVALENGRLVDRLHQVATSREHEARHDRLTGLPNRSMFGERLREALVAIGDGETSVTVALLDLDGFKEINDTLGHRIGDEVLIEVAHRLVESVPPDSTVARLGGDEFGILFPGDRPRADVEAEIRRILGRLGKRLTVGDIELNVSGSVGLAVAPEHGVVDTDLVQRADVAMYGVKALHGSGVAFYEAVRDDNSPRRLQLATDLRSAIAQGRIELVMQPKVRLADGICEGVEALARWHHPELGAIPPDEFVAIAERNGSIRELTELVLRRAMTEAVRWRRRGHGWTVSVNVAARNLLDDDFVPTVTRLLVETGLDSRGLVLEVTETGALLDTVRTIATLEELASLGIGISVDDFGTGYSSMSYLHQLPATELKIDRDFVRTMLDDGRAEAISRSILDLGRNLGLRVVAEGVEDDDLWHRLRIMGCDLAQGYHIAHPMPAEELEAWRLEWSERCGRAGAGCELEQSSAPTRLRRPA